MRFKFKLKFWLNMSIWLNQVTEKGTFFRFFRGEIKNSLEGLINQNCLLSISVFTSQWIVCSQSFCLLVTWLLAFQFCPLVQTHIDTFSYFSIMLLHTLLSPLFLQFFNSLLLFNFQFACSPWIAWQHGGEGAACHYGMVWKHTHRQIN